jgi:hypothetical protein
MKEHAFFNREIETMAPEKLAALQAERFKTVLARVWDTNPLQRKRLQEAGISRAAFPGPGDIADLPPMDKTDFRAGYPLALSCVDRREVAEMHMSSGSTGVPVVMPYTQADIGQWAECMARCYCMAGVKKGDTIQITPSFGLFNGGRGEDISIQRSGYGMIDYHRVSTDQMYLKIEKVGNDYKFYSKTRPDYSWTLEETVSIARYPISVGLILKTWEPSTIYADFDYFDFVSSSRSFRDDFNGPLSDDWYIHMPKPKWHDSFSIDSEIPFVGDFDGDGLDDIITFKNQKGAGEGDVYVALSQPEKREFGLGLLWTNNFCLRNEIPLIGDFNGDGRDDIVTFNRDTGKVYVALSTVFGFRGSRWQWHSDFCRGSNSTPLVGDFDGDGRDDIACITLDGTRARVWVAPSNPSTITYYWPGGCSPCSAATFYTKTYYPDICP